MIAQQRRFALPHGRRVSAYRKILGRDGSPSRPTFAAQPPLSRSNGASRLNLGAARRAAPTFGERFALPRGRRASAYRKIPGRDGSPSRPTFAAQPPPSPSYPSGKIVPGQSLQSPINPARTGFSRTYRVFSWKFSSPRSRCSKKSRCQSNRSARAVHRFQSRMLLPTFASGGNPRTKCT